MKWSLGRTLLSDVLDFGLWCCNPNKKVKSVGQECPTHTRLSWLEVYDIVTDS